MAEKLSRGPVSQSPGGLRERLLSGPGDRTERSPERRARLPPGWVTRSRVQCWLMIRCLVKVRVYFY